MSIKLWIGIFITIAVLSVIAFLYFFMKDSKLRLQVEKKGTVLLVDCALLFTSFLSVAAGVLLYMNWQEQLNYFLNR